MQNLLISNNIVFSFPLKSPSILLSCPSRVSANAGSKEKTQAVI
ncbi:hypothetical protein OTSKATO_1186 [Orientia tsutsugamushi str. Kato PP]|uniref:Uncharacterized protein n=1 Tax=Orientia tsutsugamushi TaxID=784 RepID=A0A2U3RJU4_ORITS|nr:hypothetical protein OTSKATO_1186 [Orientia tsutsugamushi str. Kato PP]SPR13516.1 Uncharacterised protein [Orientia tsutsugamushi]